MSDRAMAHLIPVQMPQWSAVNGRDLLLGLLLLATLMMPVSYRAGTDNAHSHSVFQVMIDTVIGHPHRHDQEPVRTTPLAPSPFAPAVVPLETADQIAAPAADSDVADILASAPAPMTPFTSLQLLSLLIAGLLVSTAFRQRWPERLRPATLSLAIEIPPPRVA